MANLFLPKIATWFRLDEYVRKLTSRVEALENVPAPTGDFIPLTGTENGNPVTGNVQVYPGFKTFSENLIGQTYCYYSPLQFKVDTYLNTGFNGAFLSLDANTGNVNIYSYAVSETVGNSMSMDPGGIEFTAYEDNQNIFSTLRLHQNGLLELESINGEDPGPGLVGTDDYQANYTDKSFVQKAYVDAQKPYKVYTALLTQSGTNAPVATVLENTLGNLTWSRNSAGNYQVESTGLFTAAKTFVVFGSTLDSIDERDVTVFHQRESDNIITIRNRNIFFSTTDISDNLLVSLPIEIRVYN